MHIAQLTFTTFADGIICTCTHICSKKKPSHQCGVLTACSQRQNNADEVRAVQSPIMLCKHCVGAVCALCYHIERLAAANILNMHKDNVPGSGFVFNPMSRQSGVLTSFQRLKN